MLPSGGPGMYVHRNISMFKSGKAREWAGHTRGVWTVEWNNDGKYLASAGEDKYIKLWTPERLNSGTRTSDLSFEVPPNANITSLAWPRTRTQSTNSNISSSTPMDGFVTGADNGFLYMWDPRQSKPTASTRMSHVVLSVSFIPDSPNLLVATANNAIEILDPRYFGQTSLQKRDFSLRLNVAQVDTSDQLRIFVGLEDGVIQCLDATTLEPWVPPFQAHLAPCTAIAFDPMKRFIASGGLDSLIVLFEWDTLIPYKVCKYDEDAAIRDLSFTFQGEFLSAAADSPNLTTWATDFGLPASVVPTNTNFTLDHVRWHPKKNLVACTFKRDRSGKFFLFSPSDK